MYIRALKSIVTTKGIPIKANQDRVVKSLNIFDHDLNIDVYNEQAGYNRFRDLVGKEKMLLGSESLSLFKKINARTSSDSLLLEYSFSQTLASSKVLYQKLVSLEI